jgi:ABC-2 type transport system ATP-binding protein
MIIETKHLKKTFTTRKGIVESVKDVTIEVKSGEIFGFIGPNGAGKTTSMRMLTTLLQPSGGTARIAGFDLARESQHIRKKIGYVSQSGGLEPHTSARENLVFQAQLYGASSKQAAARAQELIHTFALESFADRVVSTYSGGQRRRVDIALALVHHPTILFLDEPTTGLDPQSRAHLWDELKKVQAQGTTLFLTTHYLDEADTLCDRIAIIDHGKIVAQGTPAELKKQIAGDIVTLGCATASYKDIQELIKEQTFVREINESAEGFRIYVEEGEIALMQLVRLLDKAHVPMQAISLSRPTLDDVFLKQTGRSLREKPL